MLRFIYAMFMVSFTKFRGTVETNDKRIEIDGSLYIRKFSPITWIILLLVHIVTIKDVVVSLKNKEYVKRFKTFFSEPVQEDIEQRFTLLPKTSNFRKRLTIFCLKYT